MEVVKRVWLGTGVEVRAEGDQPPKLRGYAAVFNQTAELGWMKEQLKPGCFTRALKEQQDVRALVDHDPALILGRSKAGTLTLQEDEKGLYVEITPPDTSIGRDTVESVRRGDLDQMSFAFIARRTTWVEEEGQIPTRIVEDVDLLDVSVVTFPAYEQTSVSVRAAHEQACRTELAERKKQQHSDPALVDVYARRRW